MTEAEINATIAKLEAAKMDLLTGKRRQAVSYSGTSVQYSPALLGSLEQINQELARLRVELSLLTGSPSGVGPLRVGFGDRT